jgi:hypothetical protein
MREAESEVVLEAGEQSAWEAGLHWIQKVGSDVWLEPVWEMGMLVEAHGCLAVHFPY